MKRYGGYCIWAAICICITAMVVFQTAAGFGDKAGFDQVAEYMVGDTQKILFNNMLYFAALVYLGKKNYMDVHVVMRCKNQVSELVMYMNFHGMILCGVFLLMLVMGLLISTVLAGIAIRMTVGTLLLIVLAAVFAFSWYMIYSVAYTISKSHIAGFFAIVISQLIILVIHFFLQFMCDFDMSKYLLNFIFPIIVIAVTETIQISVLQKREWY